MSPLKQLEAWVQAEPGRHAKLQIYADGTRVTLTMFRTRGEVTAFLDSPDNSILAALAAWRKEKEKP